MSNFGISRAQQSVQDRVGDAPCPVCGETSSAKPLPNVVGLMIVEYDATWAQSDEGDKAIDGSDISGLQPIRRPGVAFKCERCGFLRFHVVRVDPEARDRA